MILKRISDSKTLNLYKNLCKKICAEHFLMCSTTDRNLNYLWWMYTKGVHAGETNDFIVMAEILLLHKMGFIDADGVVNMRKMLSSNDTDNIYIALMSLKAFRLQRIKKYGEYGKDISPELAELSLVYSEFINPMTIKIEEND